MPHPNAELIERLYGMFAAGETDAVTKYLSDDLVVHVPGRNPVAGDYKGPDGFIQFMTKTFELGGPGMKFELETVIADDEHAVAFEQVTADRDGKHLEVDDFTVFRFRNGKIYEMVLTSSNPYAWDEFWA